MVDPAAEHVEWRRLVVSLVDHVQWRCPVDVLDGAGLVCSCLSGGRLQFVLKASLVIGDLCSGDGVLVQLAKRLKVT